MELTIPGYWEKFGVVTPDEAAAAFMPFFDMFCFNQGACRVIGEIIAFAGAISPDVRWLPCDGASLLRVDYPDLFAVIGTAYGAVDSSHFNLPDLRGRAPISAGMGPGLSARAIGDSFGEEAHTLTEAELASHAHTQGNSLSSLAVMPGEGPVLTPNPIPAWTGNTGGNAPHNNMQPSLAINYLIVALT